MKRPTPEQITVPNNDFNLPKLRQQTVDLVSAGKTFSELLVRPDNNCSDSDTPILEKNHKYHFDPRNILTMRSHKRKALHITEFLYERTKKRRQHRRKELVLSADNDNDDRLVLKTEEDHPYAGISIGEWGAANCRLLNALLDRNHMDRVDIEYYLAYTAMIFEFSTKYIWDHVLEYDFHYRELQAAHDFQWGVTSPELELKFLIQQTRNHSQQQSGYVNRQQQMFNGQKRNFKTELCRLFISNRGNCPYGARCRYFHDFKALYSAQTSSTTSSETPTACTVTKNGQSRMG